MGKLFHRLLYRLLSLEGYLRVVSRLFFLTRALGIGRRGRALEYNYHLPNLVSRGATAIDIGANLGYYTRPLADIVGAEGRVYAVEPVPVIFDVLKQNDAFHALQKVGGLVYTGPTGTNVNDVAVALLKA